MSKSALVTGASTGIGKAIAKKLAENGYKVIIHYNSNKEKAENLLRDIQNLNKDASLVQFNLNDLPDVEKKANLLDVDLLVNNAGIHQDQPALLMSMDSFDSVMKTNLYGAFLLTKILAKKMLARRNGNIINISSLSGQVGNAGQANYAASKAALIALTKTLAMELGPRGIRVNAIAPGLIDTEMIKTISNLDEYKKKIPLGRVGTADEIASVVYFLASEEAAYITGQTLSVNGGLFAN